MPAASETRGLFGGGSTPSRVDDIDYITIASEGNGIDFGELTQNAVVQMEFCLVQQEGCSCMDQLLVIQMLLIM